MLIGRREFHAQSHPIKSSLALGEGQGEIELLPLCSGVLSLAGLLFSFVCFEDPTAKTRVCSAHRTIYMNGSGSGPARGNQTLHQRHLRLIKHNSCRRLRGNRTRGKNSLSGDTLCWNLWGTELGSQACRRVRYFTATPLDYSIFIRSETASTDQRTLSRDFVTM